MGELRRVLLLVMVALMVSGAAFATGEVEPAPDAEENQGLEGPLVPYDPPITVSWAFSTSDLIEESLTAGDMTHNDNIWLDRIEETLGVRIEYEWVAPGANDQYNNKVSIAIASGDLPDFLHVNDVQLRQMLDGELIQPLGQLLEEYGTEETREMLAGGGEEVMLAATRDGQLYGIPQVFDAYTQASFISIRHDWLDAVGMDVPRTFAELETVMDAFIHDDPDGDGEDDTFALAMTKNFLTDAVGEARWVFNGHDAFPRIWIENEQGDLVYGSIQPEVRGVLQMLNDWYEAGYIDPEFVVKDSGKIAESIAAGNVGIHSGAFWGHIWPLDASFQNDGADWRPVPLIGEAPEDLPKTQVGLPASTWFVASRDAEHPEALIKILSMMVDAMTSEQGLEWREHDLAFAEETGAANLWQLRPIYINDPLKNLKVQRNIAARLEDPSVEPITPDADLNYDSVVSWIEDQDPAGWKMYWIFGPEGSTYDLMEGYLANDQMQPNKYVGPPTDTMTRRWETLVQMENEVFTRIIVGEASIDEFDDFVEDWKSLGGEDITDEVNAWYDLL